MKTVIVTGATSGIGFEVCKLLSDSFRIIGIGRNPQRCEDAKKRLLQHNSGADITFFCADMMHLSSLKNLCDMLTQHLQDKCGGQLYALINNAGCVKSWYSTTEDGYEQQFALNHLASFYMTYRLINYLGNNGRILFTGSLSHKMTKIRWNNIMLRKRYNPLFAYKQSKLCNILFAYELNRRYGGKGIRAYVVDPGLVNTDIGNKETGWLVNFVWSLRKKHGTSAGIPAKTYLYLCENTPDGLYFFNSMQKEYSKEVNAANSERLFKLSEQLCGISYGDIL